MGPPPASHVGILAGISEQVFSCLGQTALPPGSYKANFELASSVIVRWRLGIPMGSPLALREVLMDLSRRQFILGGLCRRVTYSPSGSALKHLFESYGSLLGGRAIRSIITNELQTT